MLNAGDLKPRRTLQGIQDKISHLALSLDGAVLAASTADGAIKVWNATDGTVRQIRATGGEVSALRFGPQDQTIALARTDGTVSVWNAQNGALGFELKKHQGAVNAIAFSRDGRLMATGGDDRTAIIWEVASAKVRRTYLKPLIENSLMNRRRVISALSGLVVLLCLGQYEAAAQSTIMNVPSTDVVAAKKVYVEMDFLTNYAWQRQGSFQNYIPRAVLGVARNVEVGANVSFTHVSGQQLPIEVQPNVKWQFYSNEGAHTAAAVGCILYAPITHRAGTDTLGQCYLVGSKRLSGRLGPRFTGGRFAFVGDGAEQRTKGGASVGYEQT